MTDILVPAVIGGVGVYILAKQSGPPLPPGSSVYGTPTYGSTMGDIVNGVPNGGGGYYDPFLDPSGQAAFNIDGRSADPDARQKLDLLNAAMQGAYNGMSAAGKASAADQLNQKLNLDPPLRGNETWDTVARVAGGAAAAAGCNAIPGIGTAVSPLCAMAGAYLGVKLEQWMSTNLGDLGSWVSDNVSSAVHAIGDQVSDWFHDIF
jgi:hypothetical protein